MFPDTLALRLSRSPCKRADQVCRSLASFGTTLDVLGEHDESKDKERHASIEDSYCAHPLGARASVILFRAIAAKRPLFMLVFVDLVCAGPFTRCSPRRPANRYRHEVLIISETTQIMPRGGQWSALLDNYRLQHSSASCSSRQPIDRAKIITRNDLVVVFVSV